MRLRILILLCCCLATSAMATEQVRLQLKWRHQFQFAGYYAAEEKGYYREAGLDVKLIEAKPDTDVVAEVVAGRAEFGVGTSELVVARQQFPVVALAVIMQHSPQVLLAHATKVSSLHDLAGKKLMIEPHASELIAYLRAEGLGGDKIQIVPHSFSPQALIRGEVAGISAYSTTEPYQLRKARIPFLSLNPRASGIDFYGDNLFTVERELESKPARAQAFLAASLRGWEYAMGHPDEIIKLILTRYNSQGLDADFLHFEAAEMARLMQPELVQIGQMNPGRWGHIAETFTSLGMLPAGTVLDGLIYKRATPALPGWVLPSAIGGGILVTVFGLLATLSIGLSRSLRKEVGQHQEALHKLGESESHYRLLAENAHDVIWVMDLASNRFTYISPSVERLRGYTVEEVMAQDVGAALTPESRLIVQQRVTESLTRIAAGDLSARSSISEVQQPHRDGRLIDTEVVTNFMFDEQGRPNRILGVTRDITERKRAENAEREAARLLEQQLTEITELQTRLKEQAIRDPLTGLYNRRYLDETLPRELSRAKREGYALSLIMVDIDHFKHVNDTYGHPAGDEVIRVLARILSDGAREGDIACRYGGEEFVVALPRMDLDAAMVRAEKWRLASADFTVTHGELVIRFTLSAGIAAFPAHGADMDTLVHCADVALYRSKNEGRNRVTSHQAKEHSDAD